MNTYSDSFGNRWTTEQIERKSKETSLKLLYEQFIEHGYNFCTHCKRNDCKPIDMAHLVSRKEAKEGGFVEILWSEENQKILGRRHHKKIDGLDLQFYK